MDALRVSPALLMMMMVLAAERVHAYKPVVIVHGIFDGPKELINLSGFIETMHPGTQVTVLSVDNYLESVKPLWHQVKDFREALMKIMTQNPDGVHLLCFSQGGLICRALLSTTPFHNVETFIALSSPLAGQYGDTNYLQRVFPDSIKELVFLICYNILGQKVSVCDYWKDPHHISKYLNSNSFLPLINGEKPHRLMKAWRDSFLRLKKMVLIGGPDDGVITPWQSSHFGFYDQNEDVVEMRNQEVGGKLSIESVQFYQRDAFGLKTLDERGDVEECVVSGVKHTEWHSNLMVFQNCIEKWLT